MTMGPKKIVGVSYDSDDPAPLVMLKASGPEAEQLLQKASQTDDVPVVCDPQLVNQLYRVPIDQPIGRELFPVMALLLAHVLRLDRREEGQQHE